MGQWHWESQIKNGSSQGFEQNLGCEMGFITTSRGEGGGGGGGIHEQFTYLSAINVFLSITTFLGNALILVALHKEFLHPSSKALLRSLTTTDLCVGLVSQPLVVVY